MARTNLKVKNTPVFTHEGAQAKNISLERQLERSVMSCMLFEGTFYEDGVEIANRIADLAGKVDPAAVADMAIRARTEGNLRHVSLWLTLALIKRSYKHASKVVTAVVQRADEMAELLSMYWAKDKNQPISWQLKKGLKDAFEGFDAYQLAKYRGLENAVTLRDVMFMVHPKPSEALIETYKQLADNTLPAPKTWEKRASAGEDQKELFTDMIQRNKLGALAMLRNLRNMQEAKVDEKVIRQGLSQMNVERVLPFRFITAARYAPQFEGELEAAMFKCLALENKLPGTTHLLIDVSGSMDANLNSKSEVNRIDAACGVGMLLREMCEHVKVFTFSNLVVPVPPRRGFALRDAVRTSQQHGGTYLGKAVASMSGYDRLIVITDEQTHDRVVAPKTGLNYVVNVAPYKNGVGYNEGWTAHIDGWSDSVVRYIEALESDILN